MATVTLFVDTSPQHFTRWLEQHTMNVSDLSFPTERGRLVLSAARCGNLFPAKVTAEMEGVYLTADNDGRETAWLTNAIIRFVVVPLSAHRIEVQAECMQPLAVGDYFETLLADIAKRWPDPVKRTSAKGSAQKRGPTLRTQMRAEVFKRLKDAHPDWGYDTVARIAREEIKVTDIGPESVRNAYRSMGWTWERADRVR